jgi:hypothetical protein
MAFSINDAGACSRVSASRVTAGVAAFLDLSRGVQFCSDASPHLALHHPIEGWISMTMTAQEYRANARQCLSWAESASDPENRDAFFALAATWEAAADRIESSTAAPGDQCLRRTTPSPQPVKVGAPLNGR